MMCRPLCVDHVAAAAERFGADSEITDAKKPFISGGASQTPVRPRMTGGRGKIWRGFGNYGREEAFYTRRHLPNPRSSADDRRLRKDSARIRKLRTRRSFIYPVVSAGNGRSYPQINKRKPAQRAGLSAEETKVYALTLIVASALFSPSALTVSVTVPPA